MAKSSTVLSPQQILLETSAYFGQKVLKLTAPGGRSRTSFRAHFSDHTIIVSQRADAFRSSLEARILVALAPLTPHVPRLLGQSGGLIFQEDAGALRLNWAIHTLVPAERVELAAKAIEAILSIHRAAARADLCDILSAMPLRRIVGDDLLAGAARFLRQMQVQSNLFDQAQLSPGFSSAPSSFVKWDCRAGNAALDTSGLLRWFDFEDARLGHGPEDLAWLIADETWPIDPLVMLDLIRARLTPEEAPDPEGYMRYLQEYATLQTIRRIRLILSEAKTKGWLDKVTILKYDRVGTNPHMGEWLASSAARLAALNASTRSLVPSLEKAADVFRRVRIPASLTDT